MQPGDRLGGLFEIERLAGAGGMAEVYKARDVRTGEAVAIKVLRPEAADQSERFMAEGRLLRELSHPAIVRYVTAGSWADTPYLAMEWLEGEDLAARLVRGPLTMAESLEVAERVAEALGVAHAHGVVHRDIKPSNLFLPGGDLGQVKVLDFGIARLGGRRRALTATGSTLGTPWYMAPEQARGERGIDARADVYSLGTVLHECLTGRPVVEADDIMAALAKVVLGDVARLREVMPEAPPAVDGLVARMLAKDPALRPADGAAVAAEVAEIRARAPEFYVSQVPPAPSLTPAERRLLCVILAGEARDESLESGNRPTRRVLVPRAMERLIDIARAHGGRVETLATGLMVLLGGGALATDMAARAARCAMALRRELGALPMAIATVRGEIGGAATTGEAIDRVARMVQQSVAPPPAEDPEEPARPIRIDDVTAGLLGARFRVGGDSRGLLLLGERGAEGEAHRLLGQSMACVGRDPEIATLEALYAACEDDGAAGAVLLVGAAGVGKSRLLHEFLRRVAGREAPPEVWLARGDPLGAGSPFGLLAQALRRAAGVLDGEAQALRQAKLRARVGRHLGLADAQRVAEFLGELSGVAFPDGASPQLRAARGDALLMGDQMRRAWEDLLSAETAAQPVLVVLEDLHWGDGPTVRLIDTALRSLRDRSWLVVATARPEVEHLFPKLWAERNVQTVRVKALSPRAAERLVRQALGPGVDTARVTRLVERSEGNALFLEELVRAEAAGHGDTPPATVLAIVQSRIEGMEAEARRVLRAAAVFGQVFWRGGVQALLGTALAVEPWLGTLVSREVLVRRTEGRFPDDDEFTFRHALLRDAAYEMLTDTDRALGHRLAGEWLEATGECDALVLAEHYERGGVPDRAAGFYLTAATQALEGNDLDAALARAGRGLACAGTSPAAAVTRGRLLLVQAEAHNWRTDAAQAVALAQAATEVSKPGGTEWFRAAGEVAVALGRMGQFDRLGAWVRQMRGVPPREEAVSAALTCWARTAVHLYYAEQGAAADALMESLEEYALGRTDLDLPVTARMAGARASRALARGEFGAVLTATTRAAADYDLAGDVRNAAMQRLSLGVMYARCGAWTRAEQALAATAAQAERAGLRFVRPLTALGTARVRIAQGRYAQGLAEITEALGTVSTQAQQPTRLTLLTLLAETHLAAGDVEAAAEAAREAVVIAQTVAKGRRRALAVLARIELARGDGEASLALAQQAMTHVGAIGVVDIGEVLTELAYAEALESAGRHGAACGVLGVVREQLVAQAATLTDPELRRSYLEDVWENARVMALARAWLGD